MTRQQRLVTLRTLRATIAAPKTRLRVIAACSEKRCWLCAACLEAAAR